MLIHAAVAELISNPELAARYAAAGNAAVKARFDTQILGKQVRDLYQELTDNYK